MKKALSVLLTMIILLSLFTLGAVSAGAETSGDFIYKVNSNGTASVTGYSGSAQKLTIPSTLGGKKVAAIGESAFKNNAAIQSVVIPDSVTEIGESAFMFCYDLRSVTFGKSVAAIREDAFSYCGDLESIAIPASVTSIGIGAFGGSAVKSLSVNSGNKVYDSRGNCNAIIETKTNILIAGSQNTVIPNTVKEIGEEAFYSIDLLKSITIPNSVTKIGSWAFTFCDDLESVTLPDSLAVIDSYAFEDCYKLNSITIPSSVKTIGRDAFCGCSSLTAFHVPASVTAIGDEVLSWCLSLESITVDKNNKAYDSRNNCNALIETGTGRLIAGCRNTVIPNTVKEIADYAFCNQKNLESIVIPDSVTTIGYGAFYNCSNLKSITIPASVTEMSDYTFQYCRNLTIYGYKGSYAESFAAENDIPFVAIGDKPGVIRGDADGDGEVTILDATAIQRHLAELETEKYTEAAADADSDGYVTVMDATAIQRYIAELPTNEGIGKKV